MVTSIPFTPSCVTATLEIIARSSLFSPCILVISPDPICPPLTHFHVLPVHCGLYAYQLPSCWAIISPNPLLFCRSPVPVVRMSICADGADPASLNQSRADCMSRYPSGSSIVIEMLAGLLYSAPIASVALEHPREDVPPDPEMVTPVTVGWAVYDW